MTASTTPVGLNSRHTVLQSGRDIPWKVAEEISLSSSGLRAVARWVMSEGLLSPFLLAKEQIGRVEGRARDKDDDGDYGADEEDPER
ncbi:hypothetical protein MMC22_009194 [Lobaria immixta]|nr:hypothetical protein [Lobaria immixta]